MPSPPTTSPDWVCVEEDQEVLRAQVPFGSIVHPESSEEVEVWEVPPDSASHSHFWLASDHTHFPPVVSTTSLASSSLLEELAAPDDPWE